MNVFFHHLSLCAPLFLMVFLGWALVKVGMFSRSVTKALSQFVFKLLMPVMLFHLMSDDSNRPPVDWKVLIAFFGSCVVVYIIGNFLGGKLFKQDSTGRVITGMGGIFGNNVQLGVPIVQTSLGTAAMPTISLLIIFNVLLLWTSATACVEFGRTGGKIDWKKFLIALKNIFKNPIVLGILIGTGWSLTGLQLPEVIDKSAALVATATTPCALIVVGMGLAEHSFTAALPKASVITGFNRFWCGCSACCWGLIRYKPTPQRFWRVCPWPLTSTSWLHSLRVRKERRVTPSLFRHLFLRSPSR